jgi:DNA-binding transcriptional MocR family regulator
MKLYEEVVARIEGQVAGGLYRVGDRLPSVREAGRSLGVSVNTVYHAYNILEAKGLIRAKPQSGYILVSRDPMGADTAGAARQRGEAPDNFDLEAIALQVLGTRAGPTTVPFGAAYPDASLFPTDRLLAVLRSVSRHPPRGIGTSIDPAGMPDLRREIARRYAMHGQSVPMGEIVVTTGAVNAINLALSALLRPGDAVAVADVSFFPASFSLRRYGLHAVPVPMSPETGLDLASLQEVLARGKAKACLLMANCHYPLGVTMPAEGKAELVRLLARYETPLIDNDGYADLISPEDGAASTKAFDRDGLVLHCRSFSNSLSPDLRAGWVAPGRFRDRLLSIKFLANMASDWIAQQTIAEFLLQANYDRHLRTLRATLAERMREGLAQLAPWRHLVRRHTAPKSGFTLWAELPEGTDSLRLYRLAVRQGLSFVPGALFSIDRLRADEIALNFSFEWTAKTRQSLHRLLTLIDRER